MRVLVTRPLEDARSLARALSEREIEPVIEPLLTIRETNGPQIDLSGVQAILITSANGARALARRTLRRDIGVLTVGEASAEAARQAGFTAVESATGDVEALIGLVSARLDPRGGALYHAAGSALAGDLKGGLERAGFAVRRDPLYAAEPIEEFSDRTARALNGGDIDAVMLFSPRTARIFCDLWRKSGSPALSGARAYCLSPAIAEIIGGLGWADIAIARKPDLPSMLALVDADRERMPTMSDSPSEAKPQAIEAAAGETPASNGPDMDVLGAESRAAESRAAEARAAEVSAAGAVSATRRQSAASGGFGRFLGAMVAGAIGGGAITLSAPYWLALFGLSPATQSDRAQLAGLEQAIATKVGAADLAATGEALRAEITDLKVAIDQQRQDLNAQSTMIETLQASAGTPPSLDGQTVMPPPPVDLAPLQDRLAELESALAEVSALANRNAEAQAAPAEIAEAARQTLEADNRALRDRIDELSRQIEAAAALSTRVGEIENRLAEVPAQTERQRAAALIVAIGQLQSALADDRAFQAQLRAVQDLAVADPDMWERLKPAVDVLAPLAEAGVPTRSQLAAGFPGTDIARAAEADLAGSLVEDASWWKRLMHRLSEVVTVRPVGGDVEGDGPLERLARAEAALGEGDLAAAVNEVSGIAGSAAEVAAGWLSQAEARLAVDEAASSLAGFSARALEPTPGSAG